MYELRHKVLFWLFIIFTVVTILSGPVWIFWFIVPLSLFMWLIIDLMFFTRNMFVYEPNYQFWKEVNEEEY